MRSDHHIVSLSLGTIAEPSALVVVEPSTKVWHLKDGKRDRDSENYFAVTWLERFPAGRPIPAIVAQRYSLDAVCIFLRARIGEIDRVRIEATGLEYAARCEAR